VQLRNNDWTPWVWWIGVPRLILLALVALVGFRYSFGLGWAGAAIAVAVGFAVAGALWGTFALLNATGRQVRLPRRVLVAAARRGGIRALVCRNCHWRGPISDLIRSPDGDGGAAFSCPSCGAEIGHAVSAE
jgi:hypothetical protein